MLLWLAGLLGCLSVVFFSLPPAAQAEGAGSALYDAGANQWKRTPEQVVPLIKSAPAIDGKVDPHEWLEAAQLGPLKVDPDGTPDGLARRVWMAYDSRNIYLAFTLERPKGAVSPAMPATMERLEGGSGGVISDAVEALFAPQLVFKKSFSFWIYGNGAYGDALCSPGKNRGWNAEWQRAARVTAEGWEGEMAIPFQAFGLSGPPPPDEWWGFDFVDNRQTPSGLLAFWSYRGGSWHLFQNFGRIRFAPAPAVRFVRAGDLGDGKSGVVFEAVQESGAGSIKVELELLKRRSGEDGGPKSYFDNIESGVSHDSQAEFTKGVTLNDMITFAETFYEPVAAAPPFRKTLDLAAGKPTRFGIDATLPYGEYLARYRIESPEGKILSAGTSIFRNERPLNLHVEPYWLYSETVDVFADLAKAGLAGTGELVIHVLPAAGGKPLRTATRKVSPSEPEAKAELDVRGLPPGAYRLEAILSDSEGKEILRNSDPIERPEFPPWYRNTLGNTIEVPEPWTPVEAEKGGKVSVWGRSYELGKVFPARISSQGQEVLAAPVRLLAHTAAGPVDWTSESVKLKKKTGGAAVYDVAMQGGGLKIEGTLRAEFDGLVWYDLQLTTTGSPVEIKSLTLDVPVNGSLCELMARHNFLSDPVLSSSLPKPELNGRQGPLEDSKMPFTPYLWIGNEKAGMGFVAEAPIDWKISAPSGILETKAPRDGGPGRIIVHLVQAPTKLEKPMWLQFGLQATPIRPAPRDRSVLNIFQRNGVFGDEKTFADLAARGCKVVVFYYDWRGDSKTEMGGTPERPPSPGQQQKLKDAVKLAHQHGLKVILFTGWGVNAKSPNWKNYSYELGRYPITNGGWGTFNATAGGNGAYIDFMAWGHADLAREYEVDGVLWDSAANLSEDRNLRTGNAWVDDQGRLRPKFPVLGTRDLYRRIYNIYKGEVRNDGVIYNHGGSLWPINVYADILNRGEGKPMTAKTLRESWQPLEEFRTDYSGEPFGTLYSGEINDWAKLPMRVSTHLAVTLLHGTYAKEIGLGKNFRTYDYESRPLPALWKTFGWLPMDGRETRHYYYQNLKAKNQAVRATPDTLLSSAFVSGDRKRAIVVVSNLDTWPVPGARVVLDLASLGMDAGHTPKIVDGVTGEPVEVKDGVVTLDIDQQRYRVLNVSLNNDSH